MYWIYFVWVNLYMEIYVDLWLHMNYVISAMDFRTLSQPEHWHESQCIFFPSSFPFSWASHRQDISAALQTTSTWGVWTQFVCACSGMLLQGEQPHGHLPSQSSFLNREEKDNQPCQERAHRLTTRCRIGWWSSTQMLKKGGIFHPSLSILADLDHNSPWKMKCRKLRYFIRKKGGFRNINNVAE